jgi:hypothetical protein
MVVILFARLGPAGETRTEEGVGLTIYSTERVRDRWGRWVDQHVGYATVKEWRRMPLERGRSVLRFDDVASGIRPETVHFTSLTDPTGTFVLEQNYEYDLVSAQKLLAKYVDHEITVVDEDPDGKIIESRATLLSPTPGGYVLRREDAKEPVEIRTELPRVRLGSVPGGLITRPTLVWQVRSDRADDHLCKVVYETSGIRWKADYTVVAKGEDDSAVDVSGWVTIDNNSGKTYRNAEVKLVAGDVRARSAVHSTTGRTGGGTGRMRTREGGFKEKSFFEHKLYTLGRTSTLKDNSKKQIELFRPVADVPARKELVYFGAPAYTFYSTRALTDRALNLKSNKAVDIYITFANSAKSGLGIPLPAGTARVYKEDDADGSLEFIGEDRVGHTPRDEDVMLRLGIAFDLTGERKQTGFHRDSGAHRVTESFEIKVRNHKAEPVEVQVREVLYRWVNWDITQRSHEYVKRDWRTIHFPVTVPADGEVTVTYTVLYTW